MPPCFTIARALSSVPSHARQLTYAHTSQNTQRKTPLTTPSAAHYDVLHFHPALSFAGFSVRRLTCLYFRFNGFLQNTTTDLRCQASFLIYAVFLTYFLIRIKSAQETDRKVNLLLTKRFQHHIIYIDPRVSICFCSNLHNKHIYI